VRCACIDIGSNTTRLLAAEVSAGLLRPLGADRRFTAIGDAIAADRSIPDAKIAEVVTVVGEQAAMARELGAERVRAVATAAIRDAANCATFVDAIAQRAGVEVAVLTGEDEARFAFAGATATLEDPPAGEIAVVDVGGGSTEVAVGTAREGMAWYVSLPIGSAALTRLHAPSDPPVPAEVAAMRADADRAFADVGTAAVERVFAVGGSATSLWALGSDALDPPVLRGALDAMTAGPAAELGERLGLDARRVRLLPAGIVLLTAARQALRAPMSIGKGGLREGVLLAELKRT
jgi:exopolyphosphatase / guanosine-5'-triphosphate,3'-diphosphate pyrophosphatase